MPRLMDAKSGMFVKTLKLMAAYISGFTVDFSRMQCIVGSLCGVYC